MTTLQIVSVNWRVGLKLSGVMNAGAAFIFYNLVFRC